MRKAGVLLSDADYDLAVTFCFLREGEAARENTFVLTLHAIARYKGSVARNSLKQNWRREWDSSTAILRMLPACKDLARKCLRTRHVGTGLISYRDINSYHPYHREPPVLDTMDTKTETGDGPSARRRDYDGLFLACSVALLESSCESAGVTGADVLIFLVWRALTKYTSKPRSSRMSYNGIQ